MRTITKILGIKNNNTCLFDNNEIVFLNELEDTKDLLKHYKIHFNLLEEMKLYEFTFDKRIGGKIALEINGRDEDILKLVNIFKTVYSSCDIVDFVDFLTNLGYDVKEPSLNIINSFIM